MHGPWVALHELHCMGCTAGCIACVAMHVLHCMSCTACVAKNGLHCMGCLDCIYTALHVLSCICVVMHIDNQCYPYI